MRILFFVLFFLSCEVYARRVMVTSFEPFGGMDRNNSHLVAMGLSEKDDVEYVECLLPVVYDQAAARARECYEQMNPKPDMVVSLGEGDCSIRLETRAQNFDDTPFLPDNSGALRNSQTINWRRTPYSFLTLPVADMYCQTQTEIGPPVNASTSAGYFVCNNTAYHLINYFRPLGIPYGFIHVPSNTCSVDNVTTTNRVHGLLKTALDVLEINPQCDPLKLTPTGTEDLVDVSRAACQEAVNRMTRDIYEVQFGQVRGDIAGPGSGEKPVKKKN